MTLSQYKATLPATIHRLLQRRCGIAPPCYRPRNPISSFSIQSPTYSHTLFLFKDLSIKLLIFSRCFRLQEILRFTANYPSKIFVAQIYKFYFQQKPTGILFFIFICISHQIISLLGEASPKKTERQPCGCRSGISSNDSIREY